MFLSFCTQFFLLPTGQSLNIRQKFHYLTDLNNQSSLIHNDFYILTYNFYVRQVFQVPHHPRSLTASPSLFLHYFCLLNFCIFLLFLSIPFLPLFLSSFNCGQWQPTEHTIYYSYSPSLYVKNLFFSPLSLSEKICLHYTQGKRLNSF